MTGIYKITSPTGKVYIGQSYTIEKRFNQYNNLHCKDQFRIYNSLKKHGSASHKFEIAHELPSDISTDQITVYEQFYMDIYLSAGLELMNLRGAGPKGKMSTETRKRLSIALKGRPSVNKGKKRSLEVIQKLKDARKKQVFSKEDCIKISESLKKYYSENTPTFQGKTHSKESRDKISKANIGKIFPEYLKVRYSNERSGEKNLYYGKKHTEEIRNRMSIAGKGKRTGATNGRARPVIQFDLIGNEIKQWETIKLASDTLKISRQSINCAVGGWNKTAHGFIWKYKEQAA